MVEYIRRRTWDQGACYWPNITLISHFTFLVPQFRLWVYDSYVLSQSMLRTPVVFLPSAEVLDLPANPDLFFFLKYDDVCLVFFFN